jgi:hypothetical protein
MFWFSFGLEHFRVAIPLGLPATADVFLQKSHFIHISSYPTSVVSFLLQFLLHTLLFIEAAGRNQHVTRSIKKVEIQM